MLTTKNPTATSYYFKDVKIFPGIANSIRRLYTVDSKFYKNFTFIFSNFDYCVHPT